MSELSDALDEAEMVGQTLAVPFSAIPAMEPVPLWPGVLWRRLPALIAGPGKTGKGLLIARIAAIATTGGPWPGEPEGTRHQPGTVLIVAPEDDPNEDSRPRLEAAGANLDLVRNLTILPDGSNFRLPGHHGILARAVAEAADYGPETVLVALDPLLAMCDNLGPRNARAVVEPLQDLAREREVAMVLSHHTTKDPRNIAGSRSLTDAMRMIWLIEEDENTKRTGVRSVTLWRSNRDTAASRIRYRIEGGGQDARAVFLDDDPGGMPEPGSRDARLRLQSDDAGFLAAWQRKRLVRSLLAVACPEGDGPAGRTCTISAERPMYELDTGIRAHGSRITLAAELNPGIREQVIAQFGSTQPPEGLRKN